MTKNLIHWQFVSLNREVDGEGGAAAQLASDPDFSAVVLHDSVHNGKPQPGAVFLGGKEGVENFSHIPFGDPGPRIADADFALGGLIRMI